MTLIERAEHEIKHLHMVSPQTARGLIAELSRIRDELQKAKEERDNLLEFAKEQCDYCIGHPAGLFVHFTGEDVARYIRDRIEDRMLLDSFIAHLAALKAKDE